MSVPRDRHFLPALLGSLHQQKAEGELVLEQNDGTRRLYWSGGELKYLRSDAVGEQFGNFLIRRGVLDMASLKELLADGEGARVGDRVVQWGLMSVTERDDRLHELLASVLLHAMEHPILAMRWEPGGLAENLSGDLQFRLDHRRLVWDVYQNAKMDRELMLMFRSDPDWRWQAKGGLLDLLGDLPLTPALAFALSALGQEPMSADTITALTSLAEPDAAKLVAILWAVGGVTLVQGPLPLLPKVEPPPASPPRPRPAGLPPTQPPVAPAIEPEIEITLEPLDEEPELPPRASPRTPPPINLMELLELDDPHAGPSPGSPAGPRPVADLPPDPFGAPPPPRMAAPAPPPPPPVEPLAMVPPPPFESSYVPPPGAAGLPVVPDDSGLPPLERARRLVVKAKSYMMQDRTSEAIRALEQSIKLDGDSAGAYETWLLLGRLRLTNPAWSTRAIEALQVASRLNPRAAEPWALMGELYQRKGFFANAQGCFRRAIELDPSVAVPPGWADREERSTPNPRDSQGGLMEKIRSILGREKG